MEGFSWGIQVFGVRYRVTLHEVAPETNIKKKKKKKKRKVPPLVTSSESHIMSVFILVR